MLRLLAATSVTLLTFTAAVTPGARACDEYCAYDRQEAAYERAYERESAREEAAEEGYYRRESSGSSGAARRRAAAQRSAPRQQQPEQVAEPKPSTPAQTEPRTSRTKVAKENSSIATGSREIAADDASYEDAPRERKTGRSTGCKSYFPSVGMTLSVPCDR
jgi:hypothetical protein